MILFKTSCNEHFQFRTQPLCRGKQVYLWECVLKYRQKIQEWVVFELVTLHSKGLLQINSSTTELPCFSFLKKINNKKMETKSSFGENKISLLWKQEVLEFGIKILIFYTHRVNPN
jgi:hypothetical protein